MQSLARLVERVLSARAVVAGVLSGTSADGIDVALCAFPDARADDAGAPRALAFETVAFDAALAARVRAALDSGLPSARELALLSRDLGAAFGAAAARVAAAHGLELDLVASHGQTVWHHDGAEHSGAATLQLGDGDFVAEAAGCAAVSDFRQRDVAAGGEGAPLSALADGAVFARLARPAAILNLGGIANFTLLEADGAARSFDTGPANSLLDGLARRLLGRPFDADGRVACAGSVHAPLLAELLEHPFLRRAPPKSTGRDTFGEAYVDAVVQRARALGLLEPPRGPADLLATAAEFVARAAADAFARSGSRAAEIVLCGGGARHARVVAALERACPARVGSSARHGVDPKAREALVFAVLGARCALGLPSTRAEATGARGGRVLGKWSPAPPAWSAREAERAGPVSRARDAVRAPAP